MIISLKYLPLYLLGVISNCKPFWIVIMEFCVLRLSCSKIEIMCMIGCFVGILLITYSKAVNKSSAMMINNENADIIQNEN